MAIGTKPDSCWMPRRDLGGFFGTHDGSMGRFVDFYGNYTSHMDAMGLIKIHETHREGKMSGGNAMDRFTSIHFPGLCLTLGVYQLLYFLF